MKYNLIFLLLFTQFVLNAQTNHTVFVRDIEFDPQHIEITLGDTVTWRWQSGLHTTTSNATSGPDTWNALITAGSQTFSFVITNEGLHNYYCDPHLAMGMTGSINVLKPTSANDEVTVSQTFELNQNYPNPFNPSTNIKFNIGKEGNVKLAIYNSLGMEIEVLADEYKHAGTYSYTFDSKNLASGVYYYKLIANNFTETRKMLLLK